MLSLIRHILPAFLAAVFIQACAPPSVPDDTVVVLDLSEYGNTDVNDSTQVIALWDAMHLTSTLQGIVNRDRPRLFVKYVRSEGCDVDAFWWDRFVKSGKWTPGTKRIVLADPVEAAGLFMNEADGLVVYDSDMAATSNVASTVAGADDLLAVRYDPSEGSVYSRLTEDGWKVRMSLTGMFHTKTEAYRWAVDNYLKKGKCTGEYAAYYIDQFWRGCAGNAALNHHLLTNHDFFVSKRAFFFDLSPWGDEAATDAPDEEVGADCVMLKDILMEIYRLNGGEKFCHIGGFPSWPYKYTSCGSVGGRHEPVETEWEFAHIISAYNAFKDADAPAYGALANASFWQYYPLKESYPHNAWVTREELMAKGWLTREGKVNPDKRYVLFYVGDYDSSAWLYQRMPQIWNDPARGKLPLMWNISPVLERRVPMAMEYLWESATANDYFAAADNGAGYLNPGDLEEPRDSGLPSGLDAWAKHCAPYYWRWGQTVTGFVIDGFAKGMSAEGFRCYSKFSPDGICPIICDEYDLVDGMPVYQVTDAGPEPADIRTAAARVLSKTGAHTGFPFYWFRTVLQTPSWHLQLKEELERESPEIVWLSAPEFFELLRCYIEETQ